MNAITMKIATALCLTMLLTATALAEDHQEEPLSVYVFIGHNNARGWRCMPKDVPQDMKDPVSNAWDFQGEWKPLEPDMESRNRAFGPALGFAHELRKHTDEKFGVLVLGVPFSEHAVHWLPPEGRDYKKLLERVKEAGKNGPIRIEAVYSVNGQNDARDEQKAKAYKENTVKLIQALRKEFKNPEMIFVSIRMHDGGFPYEKEVRKAQESIDLRGYGWVDTDKVPRPDKHHYTPQGYLQIGRLFARKVVEIEKERAEKDKSEEEEGKKD
jgi:hypothetical protein